MRRAIIIQKSVLPPRKVSKYVLNDTWFTNAENMNFIDELLKKKFVMAIKENMIATMCDA